MTAVPDPTVKVLGEHRWDQAVLGCRCGFMPKFSTGSLRDQHDTHLARILAEHTERAVREALEAAAVRVEAHRHGHSHDFAAAMTESARIVREGGRP